MQCCTGCSLHNIRLVVNHDLHGFEWHLVLWFAVGGGPVDYHGMILHLVAMTRRCEASGAGMATSHPLPQSAGSASNVSRDVSHNEKMAQRDVIKRLVEMQYERNEVDFSRGKFRVRVDVTDIFPAASSEHALRLTLFDDEVETLSLFDPLTGHILQKVPRYTVYPSSHHVTPRATVVGRAGDHQGRAGRAHRVLPAREQAGYAPSGSSNG